MATATKRIIRRAEAAGDELSDSIGQQIAALRQEIATIADAVGDYSGHGLQDMQHNAGELVEQVRHQGAVAARQIGRQANAASQAVRENPIPVIVALGTIVLLSALIFRRE